MGISGNVDIFQRNRKWFFSRHVQVDSGFHVMAINEISRNRPVIMFMFRIIQCWSSWCWVGEESPSDSPWRIYCSSPRGKWIVTSHWRQHFLCIDLRAWISDASICSNSSMSAINASPFQIPPACNAYTRKKTWQDFWTEVFRRNWVMFDHWSKRYNWSVKWCSEPPFITCLPIRQEILNVHGIRPPFFVQTWLQQYCRCPFILRIALWEFLFVFDLCGVDVQWFQERSSQNLKKF